MQGSTKNKMDVSKGLYNLLRTCLGGAFVVAGSLKLMKPQDFAVLINTFGIVPEPAALWVAVWLPVLEVAAGVGLLFDIRGSLLVITALLAVFTTVLGYGIRLGLDVDCGCFGPGDPEARALHGLRQSLVRNLAMLAGAAFLYIWRRWRDIRPVRLRRWIHKFQKKELNQNASPKSLLETDRNGRPAVGAGRSGGGQKQIRTRGGERGRGCKAAAGGAVGRL